MATNRKGAEVNLAVEALAAIPKLRRTMAVTGGVLCNHLRSEEGLVFDDDEFDKAMTKLVTQHAVRMENVAKETRYVSLVD